MQKRSGQWLDRAKSGDFDFFVSSHTLAELYNVLSGAPLSPRITPDEARLLIKQNVELFATIIVLDANDYLATLDLMKDRHLSGGIIYDALLARSAYKAQVDKMLTLNIRDFERVWPEGKSPVKEP